MAGPADEIIVQITADASQLAAGMQEGVAAVQEGSDAMAAAGASGAAEAVASTQTVADAYAEMAARVTESLGEYASGFDAVYAIQAELDASMASGTITADAYAQSLDLLDAQADALNASITKDVTAINAQTIAMQEAAVATVEDSAALAADTEATNLNSEAKQKNFRFHGLYGSIGQAATFLLTPAGLGVGALTAVAAAALYGAHEEDKFSNSLLATGDAAGTSGSAVDAMAASIASSGIPLRYAQAALLEIVRAGNMSGDTLLKAGEAASQMAYLTGESAQQAAQAVDRLAKDPAQAVAKLNDQFHFLTVAQYSTIAALDATGHSAQATAAAVSDLESVMASRMKESAESTSPLMKAFDSLDWGVNRLLGDMEKLGQTSGSADKLAQMQDYLDHQAAIGAVHYDAKAGVNTFVANKGYEHNPTIIAAIADYAKLRAEVAATAQAAQAHSAALQSSAEAIDKMAKAHAHALHHTHGSSYVPAADNGWNVGSMDSLDRGLMAQDYKPIQAYAANQKQSGQLDQVDTSATAAHASAQVALHQSINEQRVAMGGMSKADMLAQEATLQDGLYQLRLSGLQKELALESDRPVAAAKTVAQIQALEDNHAQKMQAISAQTAALQVSDWQSIISPITQAFGGIVTGYVQGTLTMYQAEQRMGSAILAEAVNFGVQKLAHWAAIELAQTLATEQGTAARLAIEAQGFLQSTVMHAEAAIKWIVTEAAKAAAGAFSAMAGVPFIGPVLAVAASIAAGAAVLGLVGQVASAEGGWERVPQDGMQTMLHKDEMVLPKHVADPMREMAAGGSGGGTTHVHIHAMDSSSFESFLKRNPQALMRALGSAHRTGYATA